MFHFHPGRSFNIFTMDSRVWRPTNNQNIWILKIPQCSFGKNVQRRHMMVLGPNFGLAAFLERMTWNGKTIFPKIKNGAMWKQNAFIFIFPPSHPWFGRSGRGRKGRSKFPSTIKPVLSGHPGEWRTDCLIQVDLLIQVWQTWENIQEK